MTLQSVNSFVDYIIILSIFLDPQDILFEYPGGETTPQVLVKTGFSDAVANFDPMHLLSVLKIFQAFKMVCTSSGNNQSQAL